MSTSFLPVAAKRALELEISKLKKDIPDNFDESESRDKAIEFVNLAAFMVDWSHGLCLAIDDVVHYLFGENRDPSKAPQMHEMDQLRCSIGSIDILEGRIRQFEHQIPGILLKDEGKEKLNTVIKECKQKKYNPETVKRIQDTMEKVRICLVVIKPEASSMKSKLLAIRDLYPEEWRQNLLEQQNLLERDTTPEN